MVFELNERAEMEGFEPKDITVSMDLCAISSGDSR